jgi:hypothetical protein
MIAPIFEANEHRNKNITPQENGDGCEPFPQLYQGPAHSTRGLAPRNA